MWISQAPRQLSPVSGVAFELPNLAQFRDVYG